MASVFLFVLVRCLCWGLGVYLSWVHWHQLLNGLPGLWKFVLAESLEKGVIILLGAASSTGVSFGGGLGEYPEVLLMENPGRGDPIGASAPEHSLPSSVPGGDNDLNSSPSQGENGVLRANLEKLHNRLFDNLESIERRMDQLLARASSVKSKEDFAAWEREREVVKKLLDSAELDFKWIREHMREGGPTTSSFRGGD